MIPGTGNTTLDRVLEIAIITVMIVTIIVLIRNYRNRG